MVKKSGRDPNAPKRNLSAYLLYQNAMRDTFKAQYPNLSFGELSKHTSQMYATLSQEEKAEWQNKAERDKARYLTEISSYVPPPGFDARGDAILPPPPPNYAMAPQFVGYSSGLPVEQATLVRTNNKKVKCKDPNAPKRNLSAYLLYQNAMRDQFKADNPGMTFGQLSKYTSHMYRSLTPEEKAEWESRSIQDKARFDDEMCRYVPPPGFDPQGVLIDTQPNHYASAAQIKKAKKPKDPKAPKRARGSYVFFTNHIRPQIMKERPETKFVELGAIMGERWRNITKEEKANYEEMALEDRSRFNKEMEEYSAKQAEHAQHHAAMPQAVPSRQGGGQMQYPPQNNEDAAALLNMLPPEQQQQAYQAMAHAQMYGNMDPNQYGRHGFDPNQFHQFAGQYSSRGV